MQCPNCKHWNEAGSRFCEECGFELEANQGQPVSAQVSVRAADEDEIPAPEPQTLTPSASPAPVPYSGPRLLLNSTGSIFRLGDVAIVGREDASLQIDLEGYPEGKYVSHRHAQITKIKDVYYVEDLGSSNHTYVNQIKLASGQAEPLKEGDIVRFGKVELTFHES
ncbi:MAG: FHA domain-containing protein [Anaerolineaceae bacterium]|nr:FHA domain-containing protein [Anaerolineaceae bacterium]